MKTKFFLPALCALMMCLVACNPQNQPNNPNAPKLSMTEISTTIAGGEYQIQVTSPTAWSAQSDKEWVTVDSKMSTGDATVKVKAEAGINADTAMVLFHNDAGNQYLRIYRTGSTNAGFSVAENRQVKFAPGNLQYQASTNTWRFAPRQYNVMAFNNSDISSIYDGWIDLFSWGTGDAPTKVSADYNDYQTFVDWGTNAIQNGSTTDAANTWRTLTKDEWTYLFSTRPCADLLYGVATINGQTGLAVIPDNTLASVAFKSGTGSYSQNNYSEADWAKLEAVGAVFLPAGGRRLDTNVTSIGDRGYYWSCTPYGLNSSYGLCFFSGALSPEDSYDPAYGLSVRLAREF